MNPREVECPTCGQPAGSSCKTKAQRALGYAAVNPRPHAARIRAAESAQWERERREQERDARNEGGVE